MVGYRVSAVWAQCKDGPGPALFEKPFHLEHVIFLLIRSLWNRSDGGLKCDYIYIVSYILDLEMYLILSKSIIRCSNMTPSDRS